MKLDLGSGPNPEPGFVGVDIAGASERVMKFDLCSGHDWPLRDCCADELRSSHFIEHIPACNIHLPGRQQDALFFFFEQAWRVARPGAKFTLIWPALQSSNAFRDPTHRRFIPLGIVDYLSCNGREHLGVTHYGVHCNWVLRHRRDLMSVFDGSADTESDDTLTRYPERWNQIIEHQAVVYKEPLESSDSAPA
ncbi:MAG: hypothetical protein ACPG77_00460 [Nannocystaceae bacterium]